MRCPTDKQWQQLSNDLYDLSRDGATNIAFVSRDGMLYGIGARPHYTAVDERNHGDLSPIPLPWRGTGYDLRTTVEASQ